MPSVIYASTAGSVNWINQPGVNVEKGKVVAFLLGRGEEGSAVFSSIAGVVTATFVKLGTSVQKGDRLLEIE